MEIIYKKFSRKQKNTSKYGLKLDDNNVIEAVTFPKDNYTLCMSTQVGCPVRCVFCESGKDGLIRNLSATELFEQFQLLDNDVKKNYSKGGINYLVLMGIGEPLFNYDNVISFINKARKRINPKLDVAVCTVGIIEKIYQLIKDDVYVKLCVSLHSTNNDQREQIIPVSKRYDFKDVLETIYAFEKNGNRYSCIDIQYLTFDGLNDPEEDTKRLFEYFGNGDY